MKTLIPTIIAALTLTGCARFSTTQVDIEYDPYTGKKFREIRTVTRAGTLLDSKSKLTDLQTTQDNSVQETKVGSVEQESTSQALEKAVEAAARGAVRGAVGGVMPTP